MYMHLFRDKQASCGHREKKRAEAEIQKFNSFIVTHCLPIILFFLIIKVFNMM